MEDGADARSKMRFRAYVRVRPTPGDSVIKSEHRVLYLKDPNKGHTSEFVFDKVFDADAKQDAVFHEVGHPLVEHVLQGYNANCLAYGQTGSGKSYSLYGREGVNLLADASSAEHADVGIIPRACELLARAANKVNRAADATPAPTAPRIKLFVSFMEIYGDQIRDLGAAVQAHLRPATPAPGGARSSSAAYDAVPGAGLAAFGAADGGAPRGSAAVLKDAGEYVKTSLEVMEDGSGATFVKDLTYIEVCSAEDMLGVLRAGYALRSATSASDVSSRAHTVFTISAVTYRGEDAPPVTSRLNLVDLAGSERITKGTVDKLKESSATQRSLTALCKVILALTQGPGSVSFSGGALSMPGSASRPVSSPGGAASQSGGLGGSSTPSPPASPVFSLTGGSGGGGGIFGPSGGSTTPPQHHVPFRDSRLTRALKDSLSGYSYTTLLACVNPTPENVDEVSTTLHYATRCAALPAPPRVTVLTADGGGGGGGRGSAPGAGAGPGARGGDGGSADDLVAQVAHLKEELEATHSHYQKLLESVAGPSWRNDPGPVERAPGGGDGGGASTSNLDSFAAALGNFGRAGGGGGGGAGGGGGGGFGFGSYGGPGAGAYDDRRPSVMGAARPSDAARAMKGAVAPSASAVNARVSLLEAQVRKLEGQLAQARATAQQYEERLTARKEEMDAVRERMAGKEHAQFSEIKKLRAQVADLTKALDAERTDSANKLDDARRRAEEESGRLLKDVDVLRAQLAQVTGSVGGLVERHSAAITAEKRQREQTRKQAEMLLRQQATRGSEEHKAAVENLKQQSAYFLSRQADQLAETRAALDATRAAAAAEREALLSELDALAAYAERVTEVVRRMESGVVPVHERAGGIKAFKLPQRDRPSRLEGARLRLLKERNAELHERLIALSASVAGAAGGGAANGAFASAAAGGGTASTGGLSAGASATSLAAAGGGSSTPPPPPPPLTGNGGGLGSSVDLDSLRAQVEAELRSQVTAAVLGDMRSDKTVEYIRELEAAVGRYRAELQVEKKRTADMAVALRSVQRAAARPESPIHKAMAAHTPAGTLKLAPSWGLGHGGSGPAGLVGVSRPGTAGGGLASLSGVPLSPGSTGRRPSTSMASLTAGYRENGLAIP